MDLIKQVNEMAIVEAFSDEAKTTLNKIVDHHLNKSKDVDEDELDEIIGMELENVPGFDSGRELIMAKNYIMSTLMSKRKEMK